MQQTGCLPAVFVVVTLTMLVALGMSLDFRLGAAVGVALLMGLTVLSVRGVQRSGPR